VLQRGLTDQGGILFIQSMLQFDHLVENLWRLGIVDEMGAEGMVDSRL